MSENIKKLSEYVDALNRKRAQYEGYAKEKIAPIFASSQRPKRRPPQHFKDSSFMFIRSFAADSGSRPFSGIVFWLIWALTRLLCKEGNCTTSPVPSETAAI